MRIAKIHSLVLFFRPWIPLVRLARQLAVTASSAAYALLPSLQCAECVWRSLPTPAAATNEATSAAGTADPQCDSHSRSIDTIRCESTIERLPGPPDAAAVRTSPLVRCASSVIRKVCCCIVGPGCRDSAPHLRPAANERAAGRYELTTGLSLTSVQNPTMTNDSFF